MQNWKPIVVGKYNSVFLCVSDKRCKYICKLLKCIIRPCIICYVLLCVVSFFSFLFATLVVEVSLHNNVLLLGFCVFLLTCCC